MCVDLVHVYFVSLPAPPGPSRPQLNTLLLITHPSLSVGQYVAMLGSLLTLLLSISSRHQLVQGPDVAKTAPSLASDVIASLSTVVDSLCRGWIRASPKPAPHTNSTSPFPRHKQDAISTSSNQALPSVGKDCLCRILRFYTKKLTEIHAMKLVDIVTSTKLIFTGLTDVVDR